MGWPILALGSGAAIDILNLHHCGLMHRARYHLLAERDLEFVVLARAGVPERRFGNLRSECVIKLLSLQKNLGLVRSPRNGRYATECHPCVSDRSVLDVERNRCR